MFKIILFFKCILCLNGFQKNNIRKKYIKSLKIYFKEKQIINLLETKDNEFVTINIFDYFNIFFEEYINNI